jgi:hypothetical protein
VISETGMLELISLAYENDFPSPPCLIVLFSPVFFFKKQVVTRSMTYNRDTTLLGVPEYFQPGHRAFTSAAKPLTHTF